MEKGIVELLSPEEHAKIKGMWGGALDRATIPDLSGLKKCTDAALKVPLRHSLTPTVSLGGIFEEDEGIGVAGDLSSLGGIFEENEDIGVVGDLSSLGDIFFEEDEGISVTGNKSPNETPDKAPNRVTSTAPISPPLMPSSSKMMDLTGYEIAAISHDHSPALLKIFDEAVVNAIDHVWECSGNPKATRVTKIDITFNENGEFSVRNDGPGIPVVINDTMTQQRGRPVYNPEVAFCEFLSGTNMNRGKFAIKGGTNGVGAKLMNVHSNHFLLETVDITRKLFYRQVYENRRVVIHPPDIIPIGAQPRAEVRSTVCKSKKKEDKSALAPLSQNQRSPHTLVEFTPAYTALGYEYPLCRQDYEDIHSWVLLRVCQAAAYVGAKVAVTFNGVGVPTTTVESLARLMCAGDARAEIVAAIVKPREPPYSESPWSVAVVASPNIKKFRHMSVINGVVTTSSPHVPYYKRLINEAVSKRLKTILKDSAKETTVATSCKNIYLLVAGAWPGAEWGGQRKDEIQLKESAAHPYVISAAFLKRISEVIASVLTSVLGIRGPDKKQQYVKNYYPATKVGGREGLNSSLMLAEGNSAITLLRDILTAARSSRAGGGQRKNAKSRKGAAHSRASGDGCDAAPPSFANYGIMSLQGVIINAKKNVTEVDTAMGDIVAHRTEKLKNNKTISNLVQILGLDYGNKYELTDPLRLRYGHAIVCTDQDLDGTGKILPLVLLLFYVFWPNLLRRGFVQRYITPVIRVQPKRRAKIGGHELNGGEEPRRGPEGEPPLPTTAEPIPSSSSKMEFIYESEFERFVESIGGYEIALRSYDIKYYKGLASHDKNEAVEMRKTFKESIYTFTLDDAAKILFDVCFGAPTAPRKQFLLTPVQWMTPEESRDVRESKIIPCSTQLLIDTKAYKLEAIGRQIPSAVDRMKPAQRKVLTGAIIEAAHSNKESKVFQLGGTVAKKVFYHHGDASLNKTIILMAQYFFGGFNYPYLVAKGQVGSRHTTNKDLPSARYTSVKLAKRFVESVYPSADKYIYEYAFEDGERAEPAYYVPVIPMAALESGQYPSEGWKHVSFARDLDSVIGVVESLLTDGPAGLQLAALADEIHTSGAISDDMLLRLARFESAFALPVSTKFFSGEVREYRGKLYSFGDYNLDTETGVITVKELPMWVRTDKYKSMINATPKTTAGKAAKIAKPSKDNNWRHVHLKQICDDGGYVIDGGYADDENVATTGEKEKARPDGSGATDSSELRLTMVLAEGAWDTIQEHFGGKDIDPMEDFHQLRSSLESTLTFTREDGTVIDFRGCYLALILYWFPVRRDLYAKRIRRENTVLRLRILLEESVVRYLEEFEELRLPEIEDETEANALLESRGYARFDHATLASPKYLTMEQIEQLVLRGPDISYDYIINIRSRDLVKNAVEKRRTHLRSLRDELARLILHYDEKPFAGADIWREELAKVREAIRYGDATDWMFDNS